MSDKMPDRIWMRPGAPFGLSVLAPDSRRQEGDIEYVSVSKIRQRLEKIMRLWNDDRITMACADMIAELTFVPEPVPQEVYSRVHDLAGGAVPQGDICKSHGLAVLVTHVNDGEPC